MTGKVETGIHQKRKKIVWRTDEGCLSELCQDYEPPNVLI